MDEDNFKLNRDDTMRQLRQIAQAPGELQWRLELLSTLERMRVTQEVQHRGVIQLLTRMRKEVSHLSPTKLAELMNAQIEEKIKPLNKDVGRLWKAGIWIVEHLAPVALAVFIAKRL